MSYLPQTETDVALMLEAIGKPSVESLFDNLPKEVKEPIMRELEDKFGLLFEKLKVGNTTEIVQKTITNKPLRKSLPEEARALLA